MSIADHSDEAGLQIWPVEEAVAHAKPLPPRSELVLEEVTEEEWDAFFAALAEV